MEVFTGVRNLNSHVLRVGKLLGLCSVLTDLNRYFICKGEDFEKLQREILKKQTVVKHCGSAAEWSEVEFCFTNVQCE